MKKRIGFACMYLIVLFMLANSAFADTGFTKQQGLYYQDETVFYRDKSSVNSEDIGLELCGQGQKYAGAFYAMKVGSVWKSVLISYQTSTISLTDLNLISGTNCYYSNGGYATISQNYYAGATPVVNKAAWPGKLFIGYGGSDSSITDYIFADSKAQLLGSFNLPRKFDYNDYKVTVTGPTGSRSKPAGSSSKNFNYISSDKSLVMGVCTDSSGTNCASGDVFNSGASEFIFDSGIPSAQVNDRYVHNKFVVANGLGSPFCVGTNIKSKIYDLPAPLPGETYPEVYYSMDLDFNISLYNLRQGNDVAGGNVPVTSIFNVSVKIYPQADPSDIKKEWEFEITDDLDVGGAQDAVFEQIKWNAIGYSGLYIIEVNSDIYDDVAECNNNPADNRATKIFDLKAITLPDIYIDGVETNNFTYSNVPYNLTMHMKNSDEDVLVDADVAIVETNGLSITFPTQVMNKSTSSSTAELQGTIVESRATLKSNYGGNLTLTLIPAYNKLFSDVYADLDLKNIIGNYSVHLEGMESDGTPFKFVVNKQLTSVFPFNVLITDYTGRFNDKPVANENVVAQVMDFIYGTYINFLDVFR